MADRELDLVSLVSRIEHLEQQQSIVKKYVSGLKRQLEHLTQQFSSRQELQQLDSLQDAIADLQQRFNQLYTSSNGLNDTETHQDSDSSVLKSQETVSDAEEIEQPLNISQFYEYQLVFDRSGSRAVLMEALEKAEQRLIIVCPWPNRNSIDELLIERFKAILNRNGCIDIGWGYFGDQSKIGKGWRYNALKDLQQMERDYPGKFRLKLLGTHEKFLVCDSSFAMLGSHNILTSSAQSPEREVGIRTTDPGIIQQLINRFDTAEALDVQNISKRLAVIPENLDNAEALVVQDIYEGPADSFENFDDEPDQDEETDSAEENQEPAISAEEFLRRYNEGERDFTGINLAGTDLSGKSLHTDHNCNLSQANLCGANLQKFSFAYQNLNKANLKQSELFQANLSGTKLEKANLENADLYKANLQQAKLGNANLKKANLSEVNLSYVDLSGANLSETDLFKANLESAKLTRAKLSEADLSSTKLMKATLNNADLTKARLIGADLRSAKLRNANLSGADLSKADLRGNAYYTGVVDLQGANLESANLQQALCDAATRFPVGFDPQAAGVYLIIPGGSLQKADLSGACLSSINLSGADLTGTKLIKASLQSADLSVAMLNEADLREANLSYAKLRGANLTGADLRAANLSCADLSGADFSGAKLGGANLNGAKLTGAIMPDGTTHE